MHGRGSKSVARTPAWHSHSNIYPDNNTAAKYLNYREQQPISTAHTATKRCSGLSLETFYWSGSSKIYIEPIKIAQTNSQGTEFLCNMQPHRIPTACKSSQLSCSRLTPIASFQLFQLKITTPLLTAQIQDYYKIRISRNNQNSKGERKTLWRRLCLYTS